MQIFNKHIVVYQPNFWEYQQYIEHLYDSIIMSVKGKTKLEEWSDNAVRLFL